MQMEEFKINIKGILEKAAGEKVRIQKIKKNNGIELEGIMVGEMDSANTLSPVIYLEPYLEDYNCGKSLFQIADSILETVEKNKLCDVKELGRLHSWDMVKDNIKAKLINYERNINYLNDVPHQRFLDLAIVCYIEMEDMMEEGMATVTINHKLLKLYGVEFEEVMEWANRNLKEFQIKRIEEILVESLEEEDISQEEREFIMSSLYEEDDSPAMYVLSSKSKYLGAIGIMDKKLMRQFGEKIGSDFYIILSSIHEAILVSTGNLSHEEIKEMIRSTNEEQVQEDEILSYNLYLYECRIGKIKLAS